MSGIPHLVLRPSTRLTCEEVEAVATLQRPRVVLSPDAVAAMDASVRVLTALRARGAAVYGTTTGFGPLVRYPAGHEGGPGHGASLLAHLGAGFGPPLAPAVVRATMLLRALATSRGASALRPAVLAAYLELLGSGVVPHVPEVGSVGASGDLMPLAHVARVLTGEGEVLLDGAAGPAAPALAAAGLAPVALEGRDALALVNGTSCCTAVTALTVAAGERLLAQAEASTGWAYALLGCSRQALDPRLHAVRGHDGQQRSARAITAAADAGAAGPAPAGGTGRPLQEVYSLRCAPQVLGACRENLDHARRLVETEIDGVTDNPVFVDGADGPAVLHGGNFHGQQVAFAADALNTALTQAAVLVERQLDALLDPAVNGGAAPLLAWEPGATSGLAGAQVTATALVAEMRADAGPGAVASIPTNGGNQDVVPMAPLAASAAARQVDRLSGVLAVHALALAQLTRLRERGRAPGGVAAWPAWMPPVEAVVADRALRREVEELAAHLRGRASAPGGLGEGAGGRGLGGDLRGGGAHGLDAGHHLEGPRAG